MSFVESAQDAVHGLSKAEESLRKHSYELEAVQKLTAEVIRKFRKSERRASTRKHKVHGNG
jgi:hypothetical protein